MLESEIRISVNRVKESFFLCLPAAEQELLELCGEIREGIVRLRKEGQPEISVVIPALNEQEDILFLLAALSLQKGNLPPTEILVADNGSADLTLDLSFLCGTRVVREEKKGIAHARQKGLLEACGEVVLTTDADCLPSPGWIEVMYNALLESRGAVAVYGSLRYHDSSKLELAAYKQAGDCIKRVKTRLNPKRPHTGGYNTCFYRDIALRIGGYNQDLICGSDLDLGARMAQLGKVVYINKLEAEMPTSARRLMLMGTKGLFRLGLRRTRENIRAMFDQEPTRPEEYLDFRFHRSF